MLCSCTQQSPTQQIQGRSCRTLTKDCQVSGHADVNRFQLAGGCQRHHTSSYADARCCLLVLNRRRQQSDRRFSSVSPSASRYTSEARRVVLYNQSYSVVLCGDQRWQLSFAITTRSWGFPEPPTKRRSVPLIGASRGSTTRMSTPGTARLRENSKRSTKHTKYFPTRKNAPNLINLALGGKSKIGRAHV